MNRFIIIEKTPHSIEITGKHKGSSIISYNKYGVSHSYFGMPSAEIVGENTMSWSSNGEEHREDGPAAIRDISSIYFNRFYAHLQWCKNGLVHRDGDRPATVYSNGDKIWCKRGLLHREDDKPAIISHKQSAKAWLKEGKFYDRENGKPNLTIKDELFWVRVNCSGGVDVIKHRKRNKVEGFFDKKVYYFCFGLSVVFYILAAFVY